MNRSDVSAGDVVVFRWLGQELTGVLITRPIRPPQYDTREPKYVKVRTKANTFLVPWDHVVRLVERRSHEGSPLT